MSRRLAVPAILRQGGGGSALSAAIMALSPVGYWKLDDATGAALDSSGNGRHGSYGVGTTVRASVVGPDTKSYVQVNAGTITVPDNDAWSIDTASGLSVCMLMKGPNPNDNTNGLIRKVNEWGTNFSTFVYHQSVLYGGTATGGFTQIPSNLDGTIWHLFTASFISRTLVGPLRVDNLNPVSNIYGTGTANANQVSDLQICYTADGPYVGGVAHVAVFPGALTVAQFAPLRAAATAGGWITA